MQLSAGRPKIGKGKKRSFQTLTAKKITKKRTWIYDIIYVVLKNECGCSSEVKGVG
jgi:hypothetical protein